MWMGIGEGRAISVNYFKPKKDFIGQPIFLFSFFSRRLTGDWLNVLCTTSDNDSHIQTENLYSDINACNTHMTVGNWQFPLFIPRFEFIEIFINRCQKLFPIYHHRSRVQILDHVESQVKLIFQITFTIQFSLLIYQFSSTVLGHLGIIDIRSLVLHCSNQSLFCSYLWSNFYENSIFDQNLIHLEHGIQCGTLTPEHGFQCPTFFFETSSKFMSKL